MVGTGVGTLQEVRKWETDSSDKTQALVPNFFANKLKDHLSKLDNLPKCALDKKLNDPDFLRSGIESVSKNSTMRGRPSTLRFPESDAISHDSAPVTSSFSRS